MRVKHFGEHASDAEFGCAHGERLSVIVKKDSRSFVRDLPYTLKGSPELWSDFPVPPERLRLTWEDTMAADGNFKLDAIKPPPEIIDSKKHVHPRQRLCGFCGASLHGKAPVLLKSGQSVHLDCYLLMRKNPKQTAEN